MTSSRHRGAAAVYSRVRSESRTQQSTPEGLILLVFESLLDRLVKCQWHLDQGSNSEFDREILKSMQLIQYGLRDSLALESGGEVALGLDHTYSVWMLALDFLGTSRSPEKLAALIEGIRGVQEAWVTTFGVLGAK